MSSKAVDPDLSVKEVEDEPNRTMTVGQPGEVVVDDGVPDGEFEVEDILNKYVTDGGVTYYEVKCKGYEK